MPLIFRRLKELFCAAMPTSSQGPHWTLSAFRPFRLQCCAKASKQLFAAA